MKDGSLEIFLSYSQEQEDSVLCDKLEKQLGIWVQEELISIWHKGKICGGEEIEKETHIHLSKAHIILLLVSASFIDSYSCYHIEMKRALERRETEGTFVIPVLLRPVEWQEAPFAQLKVLPSNAIPVSGWKNIDDALVDVARGVRAAVEHIRVQQNSQTAAEYSELRARLYNSLIRLDYREQARIFRQFRDHQSRMGAFLISGVPGSGQSWLLNRLVMSIPRISTTAISFHFDFRRKIGGRSLKDLWTYLAKKVGIETPFAMNASDLQQEVIQRLYRLWQKNSLIITLNNLHFIDQDYLKQFLQEFWLRLIEKGETFSQRTSAHYLLLFLIDNEGCTSTWELAVSKQLDCTWHPHIPLLLKNLARIPYDVLDDWIEHEFETLGTAFTAQTILDNSENGVPEYVLDHISDHCGCNWLDFVKY